MLWKSLVAGIVTSLVWWITMPTLAFDFGGIWLLVLLFAIVLGALSFFDDSDIKIPGTLAGTALLIPFLMGLGSCSWVRAGDYRALIGNIPEARTLSATLSPIDPSHIRIVDIDTATKVADKLIGQDPALGSRATLGELHIQRFGNDIFWVAPLVHSGFFKWWSFSSGTPGYIMVSATNPNDARFVRTIGGKNINIKYQPGAYFGDDLERHVYFNGYMTTGTTQYAFEIDDEGNPFWIVTLYRKEVGISGRNAYGVLTVNAQNGEIREYSIQNAPAWIDRIQPSDFVDSQINDWGEYIHGPFNWSGNEKLQESAPVEMVYGSDGKIYWYTGLTSVGSDESIVGFVLIDSRTKQAVRFNQAGATEDAAKLSMEGAVAQTRYTASSLVPYVIGGHPTYIGALKDSGGLTKMIGMVNVENHTIVGTGDDIQSALRDYMSKLASNGNSIAPDSSVQVIRHTGTVTRISQEFGEGGTTYYMTLSGREGYIFAVGDEESFELPLTKVGDSVNVGYSESGNNPVMLSSFDNLTLPNRTTTQTEEVQARTQSVVTRTQTRARAQDAQSRWESMSPEDRADLMEGQKP